MYSAVFLKEERLTLIFTTLTAGRIDLSSCTGLETLVLWLTPRFSIDTHSGFVTELLASWKPQHESEPDLVLRADYEDSFTRRGFADVLRGLGTVIEAWLQTVEGPPPAGESRDCRQAKHRVRVEIVDWDAEKEWWWDHLKSCFPTWLKLGRLSWYFYTREYISNSGRTNPKVKL